MKEEIQKSRDENIGRSKLLVGRRSSLYRIMTFFLTNEDMVIASSRLISDKCLVMRDTILILDWNILGV